VVDERRNVYVPRDVVYAAMEAAPDIYWKLIIALSRFGGLRNPSEVLSLKWENIHWDWEQGKHRILVISPKTERHPNGSQRLIPMFKELIPLLQVALQERPEGAVHVISKHRSKADVSDNWADSNLREPNVGYIKTCKNRSMAKVIPRNASKL